MPRLVDLPVCKASGPAWVQGQWTYLCARLVGLPVDQGTKVVCAASGSVRSHSCGGAFINAHLDSGPQENNPLVAAPNPPHLGLTLRQAQHIFPPVHLQHLLLNLHPLYMP